MVDPMILLLSLTFLGCGTSTSGGTDDDTADNGDVVGDAANGEVLFSGSCAGCHNSDGTGGVDIGGTPSADLTVRGPAKTDAELEDTIMRAERGTLQ